MCWWYQIVPDSFWRSLFLQHHGALSTIWGPVIGPLVAVISFIFADLIILPILNIYRKYYGIRMAAFIAATFYAAMVAAGLVVDLISKALGLERTARNANVVEASVHLNYTTAEAALPKHNGRP